MMSRFEAEDTNTDITICRLACLEQLVPQHSMMAGHYLAEVDMTVDSLLASLLTKLPVKYCCSYTYGKKSTVSSNTKLLI